MKRILAAALAMCALGATACTVDTSESDKYREPLPQQGSVALALPGSGGSGTSGVRTLTENGGGGGTTSDAEFYALSREITDAVDLHTGVVLGLIWAVAQHEPTTVENKRATWGPYVGNALDPVTWRLVVNEVGTDEYDYALEGRPKASSSEADFRAILRGHGYGKEHASHDSGWFEADNDAYEALDPARGKDSGKSKVTYDLRQFPKTIAVALRPSDGTGQIDADVRHLAQGAGSLTMSATTDIEDDGAKDQNLETVKLKSQWNATGAGRAEVEISGGSLPATIPQVKAVECWSSSFSLAYYQDNVPIRPASGSEAACPTF